MKLIDMKWGYDGGGMCAGPIAGSTIVEILVEDENGEQRYVHNSRCGSYPTEYIVISKESGFGDAVNQNWDAMEAYKGSYRNIVYEYELGDQGEDAENSPYAEVMRLTQMAMEDFNEYKSAEKWFADYKGKDTSEVHILGFIGWDGYGRAYLDECKLKCENDEEIVLKLDELAYPHLENFTMNEIEYFLLDLLASDVSEWNEKLDKELE